MAIVSDHEDISEQGAGAVILEMAAISATHLISILLMTETLLMTWAFVKTGTLLMRGIIVMTRTLLMSGKAIFSVI